VSAGASKPCVFCAIIEGRAKAFTVLETDGAVAFLDHKPLLKGHCLLAPRAHIETFDDLPGDMIGPLFAQAQRLSRAVQKALAGDGSFLAVNTRISQSVPHLHLHVVPRWKKDGLFSKSYLWMRRPYRDEAEMAEVQQAIRTALASV
jgi:histidine triad (HIT) family protein